MLLDSADRYGATFPERWSLPEPLAVFDARATDGTTVAVRRHGNPDGPRLVLSHGNGLSIDSYYPFWSLFTDRFDLFVHDIRNHGWNPVSDRRTHNVPTFVGDNENVLRAIGRRFGEKPTVGVFHSLSALTALHQAVDGGAFSALVLFDPPVCPPGGFPCDMHDIGRRLGIRARQRQGRFEAPEDLSTHLSRTKDFERVRPEVMDLLARTTLRLAADGTGYELCCPREYEAQICEYIFCWSMTVDLERVACPIKVIGADPTVSNSYMPGMDISELVRVDYDYIPETTHLLQFEEPEACAAIVLEFIEEHGFV